MKHKLLRSLNVSLILSFMLFGMNLSAPKVFSAPVDTLGITDQGISTGETAENLLNSVTSTISAVAIDSTNHLGYFGSSAVPTTIYKVNIDPQSASYMHVLDKIETSTNDHIGNLTSGLFYLDNTTPYVFFGAKNEGKIIRLGVSNGSCSSPLVQSDSADGTFCILDSITTNGNLGSTVVKDPNSTYAYFGGSSNQVFALDLANFSQGLAATIQTGAVQKNFVTSVIDGTSGYAYFGASPNDSTNAPSIVQIKLSSNFNNTPPSETGAVTIADSNSSLESAVYNSATEFGYFTANNSQDNTNKVYQINTNDTNDFANTGLISADTLTMATAGNNFNSAAFFNSNNSTAYFSTNADIAAVEFDAQTGAPTEVTGNDTRLIDSSFGKANVAAFDTDHAYLGFGAIPHISAEEIGYVDLTANPNPVENAVTVNGTEVAIGSSFDAPAATLNFNDTNHYIFATTISGLSKPSTSIIKMQTSASGLQRIKTLVFDNLNGKIVSSFRDGMYGYFTFDSSGVSQTNLGSVIKVNLDTMTIVKKVSFDPLLGQVKGGTIDTNQHLAYFIQGTTIQRIPTDSTSSDHNFDNLSSADVTNDALFIAGHFGIELSSAIVLTNSNKLYIGTNTAQNSETNDVVEIDLVSAQTHFNTATANVESFQHVGSGQNQLTIGGNFDTALYDSANDKIYFVSDETSSILVQIDGSATFDSNLAGNSIAVDTGLSNVTGGQIDSAAQLIFLAHDDGQQTPTAILTQVKLSSFAAGQTLIKSDLTVKASSFFFTPALIDTDKQNLYVGVTTPNGQGDFILPAYLEKIYYGSAIPNTIHAYKATLVSQSDIKSFHFYTYYNGNTDKSVSIAFYDPNKNLIWYSPKTTINNSHTGLIDIDASAGTLAQGQSLDNLAPGDYWLAFATNAPVDGLGFIKGTNGSAFSLAMQNTYDNSSTPFPTSITNEISNSENWAVYATTDSIPGFYNATNELYTSKNAGHYYNNGPDQLDWTAQGDRFHLYSALDPINHRLFTTNFTLSKSLITMFSLDKNNKLPTGHQSGKDPVEFNVMQSSDPGYTIPTGIAYDPGTERLFVGYSNAIDGAPQGTEISKVVVYDASSNAIASLISKQSSSLNVLNTINGPNNSATHGNYGNLSAPIGLAFDQSNQRLFVGDSNNNRVLAFDVSVASASACSDSDPNRATHCAFANGDSPDANAVIGQADFTHIGPNRLAGTPTDNQINAALTKNTLHNPTSLAYSAKNSELYVGDNKNHRVLAFNVDPAHLIAKNNQQVPYSHGEDADAVFGQADFTHLDSSTINSSHLSKPFGVAIDEKNNQLFVADAEQNDRILVFNVDPAHLAQTNDQHVLYSLGEDADAVLGVGNYISPGNTKSSQNTIASPAGLTFDPENNQLFVSDAGGGRVVIFNFVKNNKTLQAAGTIGQDYNDNIAANTDLSGTTSNPSGSITYSITHGALPTGLKLCLGTVDSNNTPCNTPGVLSGTPTTTGHYTFTIRTNNTFNTNDNSLKTIIFHDDVAYAIDIIDAATQHGSGGGGGGGGLGMILLPTTAPSAGSLAPVSVTVNNNSIIDCQNPANFNAVNCRAPYPIPNNYPPVQNVPNYYQTPAEPYSPEIQPDQQAPSPTPTVRRKPTKAERAHANAVLAAKIAAKKLATARANANLAASIAAKRKATARANANLAAKIAARKHAAAKAKSKSKRRK